MKRTLTTLAIALFGAAALAKGSDGGKASLIAPDVAACYVGGCSSQLCTDEPGAISTCIWKDEYVCYQDATCERQRNGECGWTQTKELKKCLKNPPQPEPEPQQCHIGGCSGQICSEDPDVITDCMWKDEYMCYSDATCEVQKNGKCGWTKTKELKKCLKNPPQTGGPDPVPVPETDACYVGGCSGQICSDDAGAISTCEWRDEYMCYSSAVCERQTDGQCGWTSTHDLEDCLSNPPQTGGPDPVPETDACYITGCSGQVCSNEPDGMMTICDWKEEYACYQIGTCERQKDGNCGWTSTPELDDCLANAQPEPVIEVLEPVKDCFVGGCSGQLCTDDPNIMSTCEWRDSYACYAKSTCERQGDGQCGWTSNPELDDCLANPPSSNAV